MTGGISASMRRYQRERERDDGVDISNCFNEGQHAERGYRNQSSQDWDPAMIGEKVSWIGL